MNAAILLPRLLTSATLAAWAIAFGVLWISGRLDAYLAPPFRPYAMAAGLALTALAALVLIAPLPVASCGDDDRPALGRSVFLLVALVGPLLLAFATTQDSFTASAVLNRGYVRDLSRLPEPALPAVTAVAPALPDGTEALQESMLVPRNEHGEIQAAVIDLLYAAQITEMRTDFENQRVEVVGQLMPARDHNPRGDVYDVVRMFMMCCAADAQPVALTVRPRAKPTFPEMTWVRVRGLATFPVVGGNTVPILEDAVIEQTSPPEETFLY